MNLMKQALENTKDKRVVYIDILNIISIIAE